MTVQPRAPRAMPLELAAPAERHSRGPQGKKHSEIATEHQAWLDSQETTVRCAHCPDWSFTGAAAEARAAALEHRTETHPEFAGRRTARRTAAASLTRGPKTAQQVAEIEASKQARIDRERAELEERLEITAERLNETALEEAPVLAPGSAGEDGASSSPHDDTHQEEEMAVRIGPREKKVIDLLADGHMRLSEIAAAMDCATEQISSTVYGLVQKRILVKVERGVYALVDAPPRRAAPPPQPAAEPEPEPEETVDLVQVDEAPPGRTPSPLVRLLSQLTVSDLEDAVGELEHLQRRLQAEHALVTEALNHQAA